MIHINLLLTDRRGRSGPDLRHLMFAAGGLVALVLVLVVVGVRLVSTASHLKAEERRQQEILRKQKQQLAEIDKFKREKREYEEKIAVINRLKQRQKGPVHILDEVSRRLPSKVWLTELKQTGDTLTLKGSSLTIGDIVAFVNALKGSEHIGRDVELKESSQTKIAGQDVYQFTIVGKLPSGAQTVEKARPKRKAG